MNKIKRIAIIPARGGSKRIPKKNIKLFCNKPIIAYSIEAAIQSGLFDEIMISTDSEEIAKIAIEYGASVPFYRSARNADDYSTLADVLQEVIDVYQDLGEIFDIICCILPTALFISPQVLQRSLDKMNNDDLTAVIPILRFSFPIQRALKINPQTGLIEMFWPENYHTRSQDFEPAYHDAGQFYWIKTKSLQKEKKLYTEKSGAIELSYMEAQDIDSIEDWEIAEAKYKLLHGVK
jgi:N-acylneuraminate cytidylyltransferase